jgi:hypothetical protein
MSSCWPPPPKSAEAGEAHPASGADLRRIGRRGSSRPVLIVVATLFTLVRLQGFFNAIGRSDPFAKPSRNGRYLRTPAGWNRRQADTAVRRPGRLNWADSVPPGAASGTTAVRAIAVILLQM